MSKKQVIDALAKRFAYRRGGRPDGRAAMQKAIVQHARNWLAQHGALPEGEHVCRLKGPWANGHTVTVDFTRLWNDPGYPEPPRPPAADPARDAEIRRRGEAFLADWKRSHPSLPS